MQHLAFGGHAAAHYFSCSWKLHLRIIQLETMDDDNEVLLCYNNDNNANNHLKTIRVCGDAALNSDEQIFVIRFMRMLSC